MARRRALPLLPAFAGVALALLLVVAAEGVVRLLGAAPPPGDFYFAELGERILEPAMYEGHPRRFFALRANYRHAPGHAGPNALGAWPFRGRPLEPAPKDAWTIAVFGDSCAYGLPLAANQALPAVLEQRLRDQRKEALVANLGVPGYTTVQIRALVEEIVERYAPEEIVLYPGAWNDQSPALGQNDLELRAEAEHPSLLQRSALARLVRGRGRPAISAQGGSAQSGDTALAATEHGTRVPEDAVEREVRAAIAAARARGAGVVVIVPPHPPSTRATHGRMFADADAVRRAAHAEGAETVDLQPMLDAGFAEDAFFSDLVHPAPAGVDLLASAVAELLHDRAPQASDVAEVPGARDEERAPAELSIAGFSPAAAAELGDVEVSITLTGWSSAEELPAITVGGAMLLDLRPGGANAVLGVLPHLAPGPCTVIAQTREAVAIAARPLEIVAPSIEILPESPPRIRVRSRPGDAARVLIATELRDPPQHSSRGAWALREEALVSGHVLVPLGAGGAGDAPLPKRLTQRPLYLQALIVPAGEPEDSPFAAWSAVATLQ